MSIPKQPSLGHTVLAENVKKGKIRWFTLSSFNGIPNMYDNGIKVPRQGWVQIDQKKYEAPSEATEAEIAKAKKAAVDAAAKKAAADAAAIDLDGKNPFESMKVPQILEYIKANNIEIEGVDNLPKSEIIKILKAHKDGENS